VDVQTRLQEGMRVEYSLAVGALGMEAANVRPINA
jgi:cold shock CspA family protein